VTMPRLRPALDVQLAHDALEAVLAAREPVLTHPEEREELGAMLHALCWVLQHGGPGAQFEQRIAAVHHALDGAGYVRTVGRDAN
jgi:hypothetical protein